MPKNISSYETLDNPDWINVRFDDGTSQAVNDPDRSFRRQTDEVLARLKGPGALASAEQGLANPGPPSPPPGPSTAPVTPEQASSLAPDPAAVQDLEQSVEAASAPPQPAPVAATPAPSPPVQQQPPQPRGPTFVKSQAPGQPDLVYAPGQAPGTQRQTQETEKGYAPEDRAAIEQAQRDEQRQGEEADQAAYAAKATQAFAQFHDLKQDEKKSIAKQAALEDEKRRFDEALKGQMDRLAEIERTPIDPMKGYEGSGKWYAAMAGFGDALANFGMMIAGRQPRRDPGATIQGILDRNVKLQIARKEEQYRNGKITINQLNAERERIRHELATVAMQWAENKEKQAQTKADYAALGAFKENLEALRAEAKKKNAQAVASERSVTEQRVEIPGSDGRVMSIDQYILESVPGGMESVTKWTDTKIGDKTVGALIVDVQELATVKSALQSIADANDGTLPAAGEVIDWNKSETLRVIGARLGMQGSVTAERVYQHVNGLITAKAKGYGGVITEADADRAALEVGKSTGAIMAGIDDMIRKGNRQIGITATPRFGDMSQRVVDSMMNLQGRTPGLPNQEFDLKPVGDEKVLKWASRNDKTPPSAARNNDAIEDVMGDDMPVRAVRIVQAQMAHETNDGKSTPNNNLFGHKAVGDQPGEDLMTEEGEGENKKKVRQRFRKFDSPEDSVEAHLSLIRRKYPDAWAALKKGDEAGYVRGLKKGGYFTGNEEGYLAGMRRRLRPPGGYRAEAAQQTSAKVRKGLGGIRN